MDLNKKNTITVYGNGSSKNHGCEAIVRGLVKLLPDQYSIRIMAFDPDSDFKYGLNENDRISDIKPARIKPRRDFSFLKAWLKLRFFHDYYDLDCLQFLPEIKNSSKKSKIAFSIGGDNYCYQGNQVYSRLNTSFHKFKVKTVLFGCSIDPNLLENKNLQVDLAKYDLIVTRESITYNAVKKTNPKTYLAPDPAFYLEAIPDQQLEKIISAKKLIGINISPLIVDFSSDRNVFLKNIEVLIEYLSTKTDYNIVFIPHVVSDGDDDRTVIKQITDRFQDNPRIFVSPDMKAENIKYLISNCELFIGARTHSTIAAYSSCIPTLTIGYSVKSRGIAVDLFGTAENYVLPVQDISSEDDLLLAFRWLDENKERIRQHLRTFIPDYIEYGKKTYSQVFEIINELN